jgi:putative transposase
MALVALASPFMTWLETPSHEGRKCMNSGHSSIEVYVHLVWSTKDRQPFITDKIRNALYSVIHQETQKKGFQVLALGGIEDHIHLLVQCPANCDLSNLTHAVKGSSSHFANHFCEVQCCFAWQPGYGARSVSPNAIHAVIEYIANQENHHHSGNTKPDWEPKLDQGHSEADS